MEFDRFTIALLVLRADAPDLNEQAATELQNAHLAHLADLHHAGYLLAAGPLSGDELRGLSIFTTDVEQTRELCEQDPAVIAGRFSVTVAPWLVPAGAMAFSRVHFPRSVAEVMGG